VSPAVVGSIGVGLLLLAFGPNILGLLSERGRACLLMNIVGAALAAWYAWAGRQIPFLILEGVWATAALVRYVSLMTKKTPGDAPGAR